jgi:hypothetical protein
MLHFNLDSARIILNHRQSQATPHRARLPMPRGNPRLPGERDRPLALIGVDLTHDNGLYHA